MKQKAISDSYPGGNITTIATGKYKGQLEIEACFEGPFVCGILVGKIVNGVAVGKYLTLGSDNYNQYFDQKKQTEKVNFTKVSFIFQKKSTLNISHF